MVMLKIEKDPVSLKDFVAELAKAVYANLNESCTVSVETPEIFKQRVPGLVITGTEQEPQFFSLTRAYLEYATLDSYDMDKTASRISDSARWFVDEMSKSDGIEVVND